MRISASCTTGAWPGWTLAETPFNPLKNDAEVWRDQGTWRVPPVVIDPRGFPKPPRYADVGKGLQLVEGHTRISNLRRFVAMGPEACGVTVAADHLVYALRAR